MKECRMVRINMTYGKQELVSVTHLDSGVSINEYTELNRILNEYIADGYTIQSIDKDERFCYDVFLVK